MKSRKHFLSCILSVLLMVCLFASPAFAATAEQDGLAVSFTTDQDSYENGENIEAVLTVENTSEEYISTISLDTIIPDGYVLADGDTQMSIDALQAGETITLKTVLTADTNSDPDSDTDADSDQNKNDTDTSKDTDKDKQADKGTSTNNNGNKNNTTRNSTVSTKSNTSTGNSSKGGSAKTGDTNNVAFWFVLALTAFVVLVCALAVHKRKHKNLLSIILCLILIGSTAVAPVKAEAAETMDRTIHISSTVHVDDQELTINALVSYQILVDDEEEEVAYTRGEWIESLIEYCGYPEVDEKDEYSYVDIADSAYASAIETAVSYGILLPDSETFNPDAPASREFAAVTAVRCMGYQPDSAADFADTDELTYPEEAALAVEIGLLSLEDNYFYPNRPLTEAEGSEILAFIEKTYDTIDDSNDSDSGSDDGSDDSHSGFIFREGVIVLDADTAYEDNGTTVKFVRSDDFSNLQEGTMIVVGTSKAYKVEDYTIEDGYVIITYSTPQLPEFLESIDVEGEAIMDFSQFVPAENVNVSYNSAADQITTFGFMDDWFDVPTTTKGGITDIVLEGDIDLGNNFSLDYSYKQSIPSVSYKFDIDFDFNIFSSEPLAEVKNAYVKLQQDASIKVGFGKDFDGNNYGKVLRDDVMYKMIELGSVPIIGADGIGILVEIDLVMNAQGTFEFQYNLAGTLGVQVLNNKPRNISALQSSTSVGVMGEIKSGPKIGIVAEVFEKDLISFSADAGVRVGGSVYKRSTGMICFDAGVTVYAELNAFENTLIDDWLNIKMKWEIWDEHSSPVKLKFHLEDMEKVPECTYENGGLIKGAVANADNRSQYIPDASIKIYNSDDLTEEKSVTTDSSGQYKVAVPGGTHLIRISADGYIPFESLETVMDKQEIYLETYLMVEGDENTTETGRIGGKITDSVTGNPISNVSLTIRKNWNNTSGDFVATVSTDENGYYQTNLTLGNYTIQMEKAGYVTNHFNVAVTRTDNLNLHGSLVPDGSSSIPTGDLRIVLTWGSTPSDLDSHLLGPAVDDGNFHIYFSNKNYSYSGETQAFLDLDDTTSYGPETTTVYNMNQSGTYSFYVHDYTNSGNSSSSAMANSGAKVQIFVGETIVATYNVPTTGLGDVWHVFDFNADTRVLTARNEFSTVGSASSVGSSGITTLSTFSLFSIEKAADSKEKAVTEDTDTVITEESQQRMEDTTAAVPADSSADQTAENSEQLDVTISSAVTEDTDSEDLYESVSDSAAE